MDSANWRIKREPAGKPSTSNPWEESPRDSRDQTGRSSGWGGRRNRRTFGGSSRSYQQVDQRVGRRGEGGQRSQETFESSYPPFRQDGQRVDPRGEGSQRSKEIFDSSYPTFMHDDQRVGDRGEGVQPSQVTFDTSYPTFQQPDQGGDDGFLQYDQDDGTHQYHQVDGIPQYDQSDGFQRPLDDSKVKLNIPYPRFVSKSLTRATFQEEQAIKEGRKLWFGSLPYEATFEDIEALLKPAAEKIEAISFSMDHFTRRNPGYCFVYLKTKQDSRQVMKIYHSQLLLGRPIKVNTASNPGTVTGRFQLQLRSGDVTHLETNQERNSAFASDRWRRLERPEDVHKAVEEGRRLHVSGLPYLGTQANADTAMRYMFTGFEVEVVSKMLRPPESKRLHDDYYWYCFIDLGSAEEAQRGIEALDGNKRLGREVKVALAKSTSRKLHERERLFVSGLPVFPSQRDLEDGIRELFQGFEVSSVSNLMFPKDNSGSSSGGCYCFVELATAGDADKAMVTLDWKEMWVGKVRVKPATSSRRG